VCVCVCVCVCVYIYMCILLLFLTVFALHAEMSQPGRPARRLWDVSTIHFCGGYFSPAATVSATVNAAVAFAATVHSVSLSSLPGLSCVGVARWRPGAARAEWSVCGAAAEMQRPIERGIRVCCPVGYEWGAGQSIKGPHKATHGQGGEGIPTYPQNHSSRHTCTHPLAHWHGHPRSSQRIPTSTLFYIATYPIPIRPCTRPVALGLPAESSAVRRTRRISNGVVAVTRREAQCE